MDINTNNAGFVNFSNKNWSFTGDKGTWVKVSEKDGKEIITVKRAAKGTISREFEAEVQEFCEPFGIDFDAVGCGCTESAEIEEKEAAEEDVITISSQQEVVEEIVEEKIENQDFEVQVSPVFEISGKKYRVILDGHHSLEAAQRTGVEPEYEEIDHDANEYLEDGDIDMFLEAVYIDCQYYDVDTQKPVF